MKKLLITIGKVVGFLIVWAVFISIFSMDYFDSMPFVQVNPAISRLWWELTPFISTIITTLIFERVIEKKQIHSNLSDSPLQEVILGIFFGIAWIGLPVAILKYIGTISFESKNYVNYLWIWVTAVLLNVVMQEYLVRGYIFQILKTNYNGIIATIISTLIFTTLHGGAFEAGIIAVLNVATMSVFVTLLLIYTNTLLVPIIVHFVWNAIGRLYLGGILLADDYPSIWNVTFFGNKLVTGGTVKIEGSIVVLFINIVMIMIVGMMICKNKNKDKVMTTF